VDVVDGFSMDDYIVLPGKLPSVYKQTRFNEQKDTSGPLPAVEEVKARQEAVRQELFKVTGGDGEKARNVQYPCGGLCERLVAVAAPTAPSADAQRLQMLANKLLGKRK
jgi:hypothetical protein